MTTLTSTSSTSAPAGEPALGTTRPEGSQSSEVSSGALAGALVGAIVATFLLTFAGMIIWMRKRRSSVANNRRILSNSHLLGARATGAMRRPDNEKSQSMHAWKQYLPQDVDDHAVQSAVKILFDGVQLHVENFYAGAQVKTDGYDTTSLAKLQTPYLKLNLTGLMQATASSTLIIKRCLACMITQSSGLDKGSAATLLPPEYAMVAVNQPAVNGKNPQAIAIRQAYSDWKALTTYFRPDPQAGQIHQAQTQAITDMIGAFTFAFAPWQQKSHDELKARQHLTELFASAIDVADMVSKQRGAYETAWEHPDRRQSMNERRIRVTPEFIKVTDEHGRLIEKPQVLVTDIEESL
ncbi:hypothetical protein BST61_g5496 [Cercospora zeina]